ncbi:hypothetical protein O181_078764 [Austropuccinia psidii MF-1]|uniref:Uncharacterized protein n=1 Tax=Austropuccinia psidii MF-1 TaxID=1389203 RepID=A0A9Q3IHL5_9BASI|nr:hypothetical protein [Austropuccinia psidii MF-1]
MDDGDEKMFPTQSKTNCEPRREGFTEHEEDIKENSKLNHSQMALMHSTLDQSRMIQKRNQDPKAHNVEKCASQKEQQRWLKEELDDNFHEMR